MPFIPLSYYLYFWLFMLLHSTFSQEVNIAQQAFVCVCVWPIPVTKTIDGTVLFSFDQSETEDLGNLDWLDFIS